MKKAYVKPVFMAEEFEAESSYAVGSCEVSTRSPFVIWEGMQITEKEQHEININVGGSTVGQDWYYNSTNGTNHTNWSYAFEDDNQATLFVNKVCDFCWDPHNGATGSVSVWNGLTHEDRTEQYTIKDDQSWQFVKFFTGNEGSKYSIEFSDDDFEGTKYPLS